MLTLQLVLAIIAAASAVLAQEITSPPGGGSGGSPGGAAGGSLSGTYPNPGLAKVDVVDAIAFCSDAGVTDAYACNLSPAITGYVTGTHYRFKAATANTGAATIAFNSLASPKTIVKVAGGITTTLADNDIRAGQWVDIVYDGTNMQMQSLLGNAGGVDSITGTANQITASAATGAITLSFPTNMTLPGTTTGTFSGGLAGNASTSSALAANPTNCSAGNYPLGIDASGNVESCTAVSSAFSAVTAGTNAAALVMGTGGSLDVSGSGTINATSLGGSAAALYAKLASPTFTGTVVFPSGQALIAPVLGTPTSATLTNATGLPVAGLSNLGSNVGTFLITPSSANLAAAITDETGSAGSVVFSASPTFTGAVTDAATLGSEEIPALTAGNWTVGAGWESPIVGPGLIKNANGTGTQTPSAATTIVAGSTYKVVITVASWSVGTFSYTLGAAPGFSVPGANGTYTDYIKTTTTGKLIITPTNTSRFTITGISVKAISTAGSHAVEGTVQVSGTGQWSGNQTLLNGTTWRGMTATGATSDIIGVNTSNVLVVGTTTGGETPLTLQLYGSSSASAGLVMFANAVRNYNVANTSTPNSTLATALGCANSVTTDTLNIACLGASNNTKVSIDAGGADTSSSPLFSLTKNDRTTKTRQIARDGYELVYNNTTVSGSGLPHIPKVIATTGLTASVATANLQCTIAGSAGVCPAGAYRVGVYTVVTSTGTGTLTSTIGWSDAAAARTIASTGIATTATNYERVEYTIETDGIANITYATTLSVTGTYSIYVTLERLQ